MEKVEPKIIPTGTIVCRWNKFVPWPRPVSSWLIEKPTGPTAKSYWARGLGWSKTTRSVRVGTEGLLTLEEYTRAYNDFQNEKLLELLKR